MVRVLAGKAGMAGAAQGWQAGMAAGRQCPNHGKDAQGRRKNCRVFSHKEGQERREGGRWMKEGNKGRKKEAAHPVSPKINVM